MAASPIGRFAPTPSGRLHLGNLLCAMLAWLSAKSEGGQCLLRIEDVDLPRCPKSLAQQAVEDLEWMGFSWDGPVVYQSQRTQEYQRHLEMLEKQGLIYPCFCTRAELMASRAPNLGDTQVVYSGACASLTEEEIARRMKERSPAMRLWVPDETVGFTDRHCGYWEENLKRDCGDFILRRSDGLWGYQLSAVVDDALSGVTQVVRGRDILSATPRQIYLLERMGYPVPEYFHIPLLTDHQGRRLAKRDRDLDLSALSKRYTPAQIRGILAWSAGLSEEVRPLSFEELLLDFSWGKVRREDFRLPKGLVQDA